jgi:hypothetical protein
VDGLDMGEGFGQMFQVFVARPDLPSRPPARRARNDGTYPPATRDGQFSWPLEFMTCRTAPFASTYTLSVFEFA